MTNRGGRQYVDDDDKGAKNPEFGKIRVCFSNDKEWFCLSDICKALDINDPCQLKARLQRRGVVTIDTPTYNQHGTMVMREITYIDDGKPWFVGKDVA